MVKILMNMEFNLKTWIVPEPRPNKKTLNNPEFELLIIILNLSVISGKDVMVSNEWLSNKIRRNIRTVKRLKSKLEGLNLIKVDRSGVGRGGVATIRINEYQVNEMFG